MAKKSKVKQLAAKLSQRSKDEVEKRLNPFEVKVNKRKHEYLQCGLRKSERGKPLESKVRSIEKRQRSIVPKYTALTRKSRLLDRRLGECDRNMSAQEKGAMRFALERQRRYQKASKFALTDNEGIDGYGDFLEDLENVGSQNLGRLSGSDEEEANLRSEYVEEAHFSDGFQKKSCKDVAREMIERSKGRKAEKRLKREEMFACVQEADEKYHDLLKKQKLDQFSNIDKEAAISESDPYEQIFLQLSTAGCRSKATVNILTANEVAKAKYQELVSLEQQCTEQLQTNVTAPYVPAMPENYDEFSKLICHHSTMMQREILSRLIICHHVSFKPENRRLLGKLMLYSMRYFQTCSSNEQRIDFALLEELSTAIHELVQWNKMLAANTFLALLTRFNNTQTRRMGTMPDFDCYAFLFLLKRLYRGSDLWVDIARPYIVFLVKILSYAPMNKLKDVGKALLAVSLIREFVTPSSTYVPEIITTVYRVLLLGSEEGANQIPDIFPATQTSRNLLQLISKPTGDGVPCFKLSEVISECEDSTPEFQIACLRFVITICSDLAISYKDLSTYAEIFRPIYQAVQWLSSEFLPPPVQEEKQALLNLISASLKQQSPKWPLTLQHEVKMFRQLEPMVETDFDPKKRRKAVNQADVKKKLMFKYKREYRGAIRELRRDNEFISRHRHAELIEQDAYRKRKTKEILKGLVEQETEFKKLKRLKERMKS